MAAELHLSKIDFEIKDIDGWKVLFVGGDLFDWGLDDESLAQANLQADMKQVHRSIRSHFLDSLSEVLGFKTTIAQVNKAIEKGYIDKH